MKFNKIAFAIIGAVTISACSTEPKTYSSIEITSEDYHKSVDKVTEVMIHDIFSPPQASRIYAYPNIAAYEIMASEDSNYNSLAGTIHGLTAIPKPADSLAHVNTKLAALIAHIDVSKQLVFSEAWIEEFRDSLYHKWDSINPMEFNDSKAYGLEVANHIKNWYDSDNYKQTRTMPKFTVEADNPGRWQPTPPAYMDGIEPHWMKIRTLVMDSCSQFKPAPHPEFSMDKGSKFHTELMEVYNVRNKMDETGDESDEVQIAQFWDCNPYVSVTQGHLMFAKKKITPGAHWIGITKIALRKDNADFDKTVFAYTKTSVGIFEGFISCWDEKYRSNLIRPETLINQYVDEDWKPILQTPPFPEYTSGHSVVSGAAATILTSIFGDDFTFDDDTETVYGLPIRKFVSFNKAAEEAAISRMYGGIHYRAAIENGLIQGKNVGNFIVNKLEMRNL
ncbi:PAP2 superfamily protein [Pustulibacterium marinum]|uniref:PAP2 superfamily protein n=1 Tax=Pustulibacterium marinum TaxID=1224947 RepID=A0A1I7EYU0_9FLAO|nr:vanadium-dependent haloperoxidase [Pustulibacterium marinum]SFU29069.1 PAP2 superfamily protein [Pustulibacterium marinum]